MNSPIPHGPSDGASALSGATSADQGRWGAEPVFTAPWQASVFAMVVDLNERGHLDWAQWTQRLAQVIAQADPRDADPDPTAQYYRYWLRTLESLVVDLQIAPPLSLMLLRQAWRVAAQTTAHGQPITLRRASMAWPGSQDPQR
jgi:nitrile hydratase accessory protein